MENPVDQGKVQLVIKKSADAELVVGGLKFVACRREVDEIDGGITLYVWGALPEGGEKQELLRFDFFRNRPHYHSPAENQAEIAIRLDGVGDAQAWGIAELTRNAPELISAAGFSAIAEAIDQEALSNAGSDLEGLFESLSEPTEISYFEVDAKVVAALR